MMQKEQQNNKEYTPETVPPNEWLKYLSEEPDNDCKIVLATVARDDDWVKEKQRQIREHILAAMHHNGMAQENADGELPSDREVVPAEEEQHDYLLQFASEELRNDPEIRRVAGWSV